MKKVAFWTQDDAWPRFPGFDGCEFILQIPEDVEDHMQYAIDNGHITQDFGFYQCQDVTETLNHIITITKPRPVDPKLYADWQEGPPSRRKRGAPYA